MLHNALLLLFQSIPDKFLLQPSPTNGITGEIYETVDDAITYISKMIEDILFSIKYQNATKKFWNLPLLRF